MPMDGCLESWLIFFWRYMLLLQLAVVVVLWYYILIIDGPIPLCCKNACYCCVWGPGAVDMGFHFGRFTVRVIRVQEKMGHGVAFVV